MILSGLVQLAASYVTPPNLKSLAWKYWTEEFVKSSICVPFLNLSAWILGDESKNVHNCVEIQTTIDKTRS